MAAPDIKEEGELNINFDKFDDIQEFCVPSHVKELISSITERCNAIDRIIEALKLYPVLCSSGQLSYFS